MYNYKAIAMNSLIATNTVNYHAPSNAELQKGALPDSKLDSELINSFLYKSSAAIKQIQENGAIQYIPEKVYNTGNIVTCNTIINNRLNVIVVRCKKDNITTPPLQGIVLNDNSPYIYFETNKIDTENWEKINTSYNLDYKAELEDFRIPSGEASVDDFRIYELLEINDNIRELHYVNTSFNLTIKRDDNSYLIASLNIVISENTMDVFINDVYCNNYNLDGTNLSLINDNSKFQYVALLGSFLMLNSAKNKLYLVLCPRKHTSIIDNKKITINISSAEAIIDIQLKPTTEINPLQSDNYKVYFIEGASSTYAKTYDIVNMYEELSYDECFKRGLKLLTEQEQSIDPMIYSFKNNNDYNSSVGNVFVKANDDMYTSYINSLSYQEDPKYTEKVKNIKYIEAQCNISSMSVSRSVGAPNSNTESNIFSSKNVEYYKMQKYKLTDRASIYGDPTIWEINRGSTPTYKMGFRASKANSIYTKEVSDRFFMKSVKVFRYMKFI